MLKIIFYRSGRGMPMLHVTRIGKSGCSKEQLVRHQWSWYDDGAAYHDLFYWYSPLREMLRFAIHGSQLRLDLFLNKLGDEFWRTFLFEILHLIVGYAESFQMGEQTVPDFFAFLTFSQVKIRQ